MVARRHVEVEPRTSDASCDLQHHSQYLPSVEAGSSRGPQRQKTLVERCCAAEVRKEAMVRARQLREVCVPGKGVHHDLRID